MNLETLLAEREIYRKLVQFARAMDNRDWDTIRPLMTADATAEFGMGEIQGADQIIEFMRGFLDACGTTQHLLGNVLIEIDGDTATSRAYVSDMHLGRDAEVEDTFRTLGDYFDTWVRIDGQWLIEQRIKDNRASIGSMSVFGL